MFVLLNVNT